MNTPTLNPSILAEVLTPSDERLTIEPHALRQVPPMDVPPGSAAERVVDRAAARLRSILAEGRTSAQGNEPGDYMTACADTWLVKPDLEATLDDKDAAVANAIFDRAGFNSGDLPPTTLRAQVEMQLFVRDATAWARGFFAKQQALI